MTPKQRYHEHLRSEGWRTTRRHKLDHAANRCEMCFSARNLQVHHKTYDRVPFERLTDLIVLCETCHQRHHCILHDITNEELDRVMAKARPNRRPQRQGHSAA